jgi:hypothetical protein
VKGLPLLLSSYELPSGHFEIQVRKSEGDEVELPNGKLREKNELLNIQVEVVQPVPEHWLFHAE